MNRKPLLLGLIAVAVIALGVMAWFLFFNNSGGDELSLTSAGGQYHVQLSDRDRPLGSPKAPVVMVEYAAPTCPVCAHFDKDIFPLIKQKYIDTGKVYYIYRVFPLSSVDVAAEAMARCLPKESYFSFIDFLYHNQPRWDPDGNVIPDVHAALVDMGRVAGMSGDKVDACINNADEQKKITDVGNYAQTTYEINATPTFIVNGQKRVGPGDWADWQKYLDGMLAGK